MPNYSLSRLLCDDPSDLENSDDDVSHILTEITILKCVYVKVYVNTCFIMTR